MRIEKIKDIPFIPATLNQQQPIIQKVNQILELKKENPEANIKNIENEIDKLVYKLYNISSEEIEIIEK